MVASREWAAAKHLQPEAKVDQRDYFRGIFAKSCVMEVKFDEEVGPREEWFQFLCFSHKRSP